MSALADEIRAAVREALREELPRALAEIRALPAPTPAPARLSVAEVAAIAHRHPDTLRRAIKAGALKASKPTDAREWVVDARDLERWMRGSATAPALDLRAEVDKAVARARG